MAQFTPEELKEKVRVKLAKGAETTVSAAKAKLDDLTIINKPAVDSNGTALPAKYPPARSRPATPPAADTEEK